MKSNTSYIFSLCASIALTFSACDSTSTPGTTTGPKATATLSADPAARISAIVDGLSNYKLEVVWLSMPKTYQADISRLVKTSSEIISKENHDKLFTMYKRVGSVLQSKKPLLVARIKKLAAGKMADAEVEAAYNAAVTVIDKVGSSDLADHAKYANLNVEKFLSQTGGAIMRTVVESTPKAKEEFAKINKVTVKQIKLEGNDVTLAITNPENKIEEVVFTKVDDSWVPKQMATGWAESIKQASDQLSNAKTDATKINAQLQQGLMMAEAVVAQLENIKTEQDLDALTSMFGGMIPK